MWAVLDGYVPIMMALRSILVWRTTAWWTPVFLECGVGHWQRSTEEAQGWIQTVRHTDGKVGRRGEGFDQPYDATETSLGRRFSKLPRVHETGGGKRKRSPTGDCRQRNQGICIPLNSEYRNQETADAGDQRRLWNDCRLGERPRQDESKDKHRGSNPKPYPGMVGRGIRMRQRTAEWVSHSFREHNKEADLWADKGAKERLEEWVDTARFA